MYGQLRKHIGTPHLAVAYGGIQKVEKRNYGKLYKSWVWGCGETLWTKRFFVRAADAEAYGKRVAERLIRWRDFIMAQDAAKAL